MSSVVPVPLPEESIKIKGSTDVYVPDVDSRMLIEVFEQRGPTPEAFVLDVCCGSGIQGISAAKLGHRVISVDSQNEAVRATRLNALMNDVEIETICGNLFAPVDGWKFDAVLANPPYVPTPDVDVKTHWCDGGSDGREVIDVICAQAGQVLVPGGKLWMVHSSLANIPRSLEALEQAGFDAEIVASQELALGPVSLERQEYLVESGYLAPAAQTEQLVVIEARSEG